MENHHYSWENPLLIAIFNSYVKSPEGSCVNFPEGIVVGYIPGNSPL
jgi:hypothetical protein